MIKTIYSDNTKELFKKASAGKIHSLSRIGGKYRVTLILNEQYEHYLKCCRTAKRQPITFERFQGIEKSALDFVSGELS
jgi:hypothetical protein